MIRTNSINIKTQKTYNNMKKRKNRKILIIILILALLALFFLAFKLTGYAVSGGEGAIVNVTRIITVNETSNMKDIQLGIVSSENVLAIEEKLIGENCSVLNYYTDSEIDIFEFNENAGMWILGNDSENLIVNLFYSINPECNVDKNAGKVYYLSGENLSSSGFGGESGDDTGSTSVPSQPSGGSPGGGGGGGSSKYTKGAVDVLSTPIAPAKDKEEFNNLLTGALDKLAGKKDESQIINKKSFVLYLVLIIVVIAVIVFLVISFLRKPKGFNEAKS